MELEEALSSAGHMVNEPTQLEIFLQLSGHRKSRQVGGRV